VPGVLDLREGTADSRLAPLELLGQAYRRALTRHGGKLLGEGEPQGNQLLREVLAEWIAERHGVLVEPGQVLVTGGARMALQVACAALLRPGAVVGVEEPGNRAAWEIIRRTGQARLRPLPVDEHGLVPDGLEQALREEPLRMVYTTPRRQNPTGSVLPTDRAARLLELAAVHRVAVFEDDSEGEIHFGDPAPVPLLARDSTGQVVFAGSLARILAPGANLGFLVAPAPLLSPLARIRRDLAGRGDRVLEWALADFIRDGELARHLRRVRRTYAERRDLLADLLRLELGGHLSFSLPDGGLALWLRAEGGLGLEGLVGAARREGLLLHPPGRFFLGEAWPCTRMAFAQADPDGLREAVRRLKAARDKTEEAT
jgi:GntR family transcriptional regulator/MocR family aminotransferase